MSRRGKDDPRRGSTRTEGFRVGATRARVKLSQTGQPGGPVKPYYAVDLAPARELEAAA
jgi:hypothetical protein